MYLLTLCRFACMQFRCCSLLKHEIVFFADSSIAYDMFINATTRQQILVYSVPASACLYPQICIFSMAPVANHVLYRSLLKWRRCPCVSGLLLGQLRNGYCDWHVVGLHVVLEWFHLVSTTWLYSCRVVSSWTTGTGKGWDETTWSVESQGALQVRISDRRCVVGRSTETRQRNASTRNYADVDRILEWYVCCFFYISCLCDVEYWILNMGALARLNLMLKRKKFCRLSEVIICHSIVNCHEAGV